MQEWIYENDENNLVRYSLGVHGDKTIICFGINPSTAEPNSLDPTIHKVKKIASNNGYDSWLMLNVYPKRDTIFENLSDVLNDDIHKKNIELIKGYFNDHHEKNAEIHAWVAFGNLIYNRKYLVPCLKEIYTTISKYNVKWYSTGINKSGAPKHPLYQKDLSILENFDMHTFIESL